MLRTVVDGVVDSEVDEVRHSHDLVSHMITWSRDRASRTGRTQMRIAITTRLESSLEIQKGNRWL